MTSLACGGITHAVATPGIPSASREMGELSR